MQRRAPKGKRRRRLTTARSSARAWRGGLRVAAERLRGKPHEAACVHLPQARWRHRTPTACTARRARRRAAWATRRDCQGAVTAAAAGGAGAGTAGPARLPGACCLRLPHAQAGPASSVATPPCPPMRPLSSIARWRPTCRPWAAPTTSAAAAAGRSRRWSGCSRRTPRPRCAPASQAAAALHAPPMLHVQQCFERQAHHRRSRPTPGLLIPTLLPQETAAIIIEPILGEGGFLTPPPGFLGALRALCDRHGMLLIFDEARPASLSFFACLRTGCTWLWPRLLACCSTWKRRAARPAAPCPALLTFRSCPPFRCVCHIQMHLSTASHHSAHRRGRVRAGPVRRGAHGALVGPPAPHRRPARPAALCKGEAAARPSRPARAPPCLPLARPPPATHIPWADCVVRLARKEPSTRHVPPPRHCPPACRASRRACRLRACRRAATCTTG